MSTRAVRIVAAADPELYAALRSVVRASVRRFRASCCGCRIKVPMPVAEDKRKVVEEVQKDRKYAIDAAVVRIMKSRKTLEHQQLVPQVLQQVLAPSAALRARDPT